MTDDCLLVSLLELVSLYAGFTHVGQRTLEMAIGVWGPSKCSFLGLFAFPVVQFGH